MAYVYILQSQLLKRFYIGSCLDLSVRLHQHQTKTFEDSFTAKADDWILIFQIPDLEYEQARKIELHIKRMRNSQYIINLQKYPEITLRLKDKYA